MALFDIDFPDDYLYDLLETDFDEIAETALKEAAPVLEKSMKASCKRVIEHSGESELVDSIKATEPKKTKTDAWIVNITPKGSSKTKTYRNQKSRRSYPVSNALKCIWKEYGRVGQPARPFITNACNSARDAVMSKMQEVWERKVKAE